MVSVLRPSWSGAAFTSTLAYLLAASTTWRLADGSYTAQMDEIGQSQSSTLGSLCQQNKQSSYEV